ncbi:MAG: bifunctional folylpolyglutamate synthase/dihydrofolate synthase [Lachnospirales bacterium]
MNIINTIEKAYEFLDSRNFFQKDLTTEFNLKNINYILEKLGNPHKDLKYIHVGGTNGKGSTVNYLQELFTSAGLRVGTYTSPSLDSVLDNIKFENKSIPRVKFLEYINLINSIMEKDELLKNISEFEIVTAIMFLYFRELSPDVVILEVGMGGISDATNVITPEISIITSIALDHTTFLGNTLEEIARQKGGIIKDNTIVVLGDLEKEAEDVLLNLSCSHGCQTYISYKDFKVAYKDLNVNNTAFHYSGLEWDIKNIPITMVGEHQIKNAGLAITAFILYCNSNSIAFTDDLIKSAIKKAKWKGRFEILSEKPLVILDGAHNVESMSVLLNTLSKYFKGYTTKFLYTSLKDKDVQKIISMINENPNIELIVTEMDIPRGDTAENIAQHSHKPIKIVYDYWNVINDFIEFGKEEELLLIGGSLYFIGLIDDQLRVRLS